MKKRKNEKQQQQKSLANSKIRLVYMIYGQRSGKFVKQLITLKFDNETYVLHRNIILFNKMKKTKNASHDECSKK